MATLQNISAQLMKPAKDLAEWKFPLSKVLEDYFTLLEQPDDINFGEAALVLQNSANVYVRRVENLYQDTVTLHRSLQDHEEAEETKATEKGTRKSLKSTIDFSNFDLVDISKDLCKNVNLKPSKDEKKPKLLSKRYPQLENMSRHKFSINILDTNNEVIGKKYDFRCNQHLTRSGMLVEDIVMPTNLINSTIIPISESIEPDTEVEVHFESCTDYDDACRDAEVFSPTQESGYGSMISNSDINTPSSRVLSDFSQTINDSLLRDTEDRVPSPEPVQTSIIEQEILPETPESLIDSTDETPTTNVESHAGTPLRKRDSIDTDVGYTSGDPDDLQAPEPPKVMRVTRSSSNELNSFKPIPFESVVPEKVPRSRREFKLPCHISLLKSRTKNSRRKLNIATIKRMNLKRYLEGDTEVNDRRKRTKDTYENTLECLRIEEDLALKRIIEERQKIRTDYVYKAVENENGELLGFEHKKPLATELLEVSVCLERLSLPLDASCSYTPPASPMSDAILHDFEPLNDDDYQQEGAIEHESNYQEIIEREMKEIQREFDVRNERETETVKWMELMDVLEKAEKRPVFNVAEFEKKILQNLRDQDDNQCDFTHLAHQEQPEDMARLFVATLHLANTYTVDINVESTNTKDKLNLILLKESNSSNS